MTNDQLSKIRSRLRDTLSEIEERTSSLKEDLVQKAEDQPSVLRDGLDHAKEESDLNNRLGVHQCRMHLREEMRVALRKIGSGTFGHCAQCGGEISLHRLEVQPSAVHCVECQSQNEVNVSKAELNIAWISPARFFRSYVEAA